MLPLVKVLQYLIDLMEMRRERERDREGGSF